MITMLNLLGILIYMGTGVFAASHSEYQPFLLEQYTKAIMSGNRLYIADGQDILFPYGGRLAVVALAGEHPPQQFPAYTGVFVEEYPETTDKPVPIGNQYQFCWDIVNGQLFSINITKHWNGFPQCELMGISLDWIQGSANLREIDPFTYHISYIHPLDKLLTSTFIQKRFWIFFDVAAFKEQAFHLYIASQGALTVWNFNKEMHEFLRTDRRGMSDEEIARAREKTWQEMTSVPIEFEGPFRVICLGKKTYIFSELVRTIYLFEGERLTPLITLPPLPEDDTRGAFDHLFIVDKDHDQALFFVPSAEQPDMPGVITIGATGSLQDGLDPALRSALDLLNTPKEEILERWLDGVPEDADGKNK
jgi:hypothetical protein